MAINFTTTKEANKINGVKILVYGLSGVGKTTLCKTCPKPIMISAESGLLSLADQDIPVMEISTAKDLEEALKMFASNHKHVQGFKTIFIDSITEIGEVVLSNAKKNVKDPRQAYGELIEKMNDLIKDFRDLKGWNVVMVSKMEHSKDDLTNTTSYRPSMPGSKLGQQLPYLFDEVFCLRIGKTAEGKEYRYLQTQPDIQYEAKDRSGSLDVVERPDLTHVFNKILEGIHSNG